jgi:putative membrane protein
MNLAPGIVFPLGAALALYLLGWRRGSMPPRRFRQGAFLAGWAILAAALVSPLHELGESLFSAHMLQHELLMIAAAPLLVWSRPLAQLLRGFPRAWRAPLVRVLTHPIVRRLIDTLAAPAFAFVTQGIAIWLWHVPALFQATLHSQVAHALQHASFFGTALLFWWSLMRGARGRRNFGFGLLSVFLTTLHTGALGALLSLSSTVYYPAYGQAAQRFGLSPLEDQQLGGLIMWIPGGVAYVVGALALAAGWLRNSEARAARRDALRAAPWAGALPLR